MTILLKNFPFPVASSHLSPNRNSNPKTLLEGKGCEGALFCCFATDFLGLVQLPTQKSSDLPYCMWGICTRLASMTSDLSETSSILKQAGYPRASQRVADDFWCVHISVMVQSVNVLLKWTARSSLLPQSGPWSCLEVHRLDFFLQKKKVYFIGTPPANGYSIHS